LILSYLVAFVNLYFSLFFEKPFGRFPQRVLILPYRFAFVNLYFFFFKKPFRFPQRRASGSFKIIAYASGDVKGVLEIF